MKSLFNSEKIQDVKRLIMQISLLYLTFDSFVNSFVFIFLRENGFLSYS